MTNYNEQETIPVPRTRVFVMDDGTFVVQWEENRVQALLSGRYYPYDPERYGNAISDFELNQLRNSSVVDHYDEELVYISPLPNIAAQVPPRTFYLNTTLSKDKMQEVTAALDKAGLSERFSVRVQELFVIIRGQAGLAFPTLDDAERAREMLDEQFPELLSDMVVAFVEVNAAP